VDRSLLVGFDTATRDLGHDGHTSRIYVRAEQDYTTEVAGALARRQPGEPTGCRG
jgi:hypothetical protein